MKIAVILKKTIILVLVLLVPGFLYYLLVSKGKNRYLNLPVYGPKTVLKTTHKVGHNDVPDTLYHTLPDFKLTDQDGNTITPKTFSKKIFIANFFYTHCKGLCDQMNTSINQLATGYAASKMVYFVSISVDPQRDSVKALKNYANVIKPASSRWLFLTGDTAAIYPLAHNGFLVNALQSDNDNFIYSDKLMLIDGELRIRGYYSGASTSDMIKLGDEIKVLIKEEVLKNDTPMY
ncbi:SCO family protein [uncultured Mucilaginibacter sp.]|uniref:SCO family protein n=1 Tax=uncultured Mucilaginibacter sp. TaxID=797541 RepID=UPI0025D5A27F|nr:SCO family protein [uncultured Mucilaginibacter sp.]